MIGADRHHVAHPELADAAAQLATAVYLIADRESGADPARVRALQQDARQPRLSVLAFGFAH